MRYQNRKFRNCPAMTILEIVIALAIITIVFAAVLPQFRVILNGWDSRQSNTEVIQNGRVLVDHISRNLSKAVKITAVSSPSQTNGYIQFIADVNDSNTYRYDIGTDNYVEYGPVGSLSGLAGPVSSLTFTCYDVNDLNTPLSPVTDANVIRTVKVDATITSSVSSSQNKTFTAWAYLRTDANNGGVGGCWKLDETSGIVTADSSGNGNNGTLVNMAAPGCWVSGQNGNALAFDGIDDYVDLGTRSSLNFGSSAPFTVSAWVKTTDSYGMIVSFRSSTDGGPVIDLAVGYDGGADSPGNAMILVRQDGGSNYARVTGAAVSDGFWHHIAAVRGSGSTIELFLDGVSQGTNSGTESGGAITTNLRAIGSERRWVSDSYGTADQRYLIGTIDDVRVYNRALIATEIATLANIPTYRGFTEAKQGSDTTSIVIPTPATNTGDLLIAAVATDGSTTLATPSGWTLIDSGTYSSQVTLGAWRRFATAAEPASYTFTWAGSQQAYGWMMRFTGCNSTNPINTSATAGQTSATPTSPAVTTTVPNCLILRLGAFDDDNNIFIDSNTGLPPSDHSGDITMDATGVMYQEFTEANLPSGGTTLTISKPSGTSTGNLLVASVVEYGTNAISAPAGWTQIDQGNSTSIRMGTWYKQAVAADLTTTSYPFTWTGSVQAYGWIMRFTGHNTTTPINATGTTGTGNNQNPPSPTVTTTVANAMIVRVGGFAGNTITMDKPGLPNITTPNHRPITMDKSGSSGNTCSGGAGYAKQIAAGASGASTFALTATQRYRTVTFAIAPQASGGTVSGGAGFVKQSAAGSSGTANFSIGWSNEARMLTIAIAPDSNGSYDCCGDYLQP